MDEENKGLYIPTEEEIENCKNNSISCDFGICSECIVSIGKGED